MTSRRPRPLLPRALLTGALLLALGACTAEGTEASPATAPAPTAEPSQAGTAAAPVGPVDLAVSRTCTAAETGCVLVNGEPVLVEESGFTSATVAEVDAPDATTLALTFDDAGAAVVRDLTGRAAQAGPDARVVLRIGDELVAAVVAPEGLTTDRLQVMLPADADVATLAATVRGAATP